MRDDVFLVYNAHNPMQDGLGGNGGVTKPAPMMKYVFTVFFFASVMLNFRFCSQNQDVRHVHRKTFSIFLLACIFNYETHRT